MAQEATIVVRLDTGPAERELRNVEREGRGASSRVSDEVSKDVGKASGGGLSAVALGAGIGLGVMGARAIRGSSFFDNATSGMRASLDEMVGGPEARTDQRIRERMKSEFADVAHAVGPGAIRGVAENMRPEILRQEEGRTMIDQELGGAIKAINQAAESIQQTISQKLGEAIDKIPGLGGNR